MEGGALPDWNVLLIGGCSCTGKSTLSRDLASRLDARVVDTDLFWMVLGRAVPIEVAPDLHYFTSEECWSLEPRELVERYLSVSRYVCRAIEDLIAHFDILGTAAILEGCWLLPEFAIQGTYAGRQVGQRVRSLFIQEPDVSQLEHRLLSREPRASRWESATKWRNFVEMQYSFGLEVRQEAESLGLPVLESRPLETLVDRTLAALGGAT
jgi:2-phosphoglycerate kinase